jgi:O-antigen ligase
MIKDSFKNLFTAKYLLKDKFIPILLLYFLFVFSISNYSTVFIILKTLSFLFLFPFWKEFKKELHSEAYTQFLKYILLIIIYFLITVYYSKNPQFGLIKLFLMSISGISVIVAAFLVFKSPDRKDIFIFILIIISVIGSVAAILVSPFKYETLYSFSILNWSHVVFGRIIGLALLFNLYLILSQNRSKLLLAVSLQIILFGLFFSGARGSVAVTLICSLLLVYLSRSAFYTKLQLIAQVTGALILFTALDSPPVQIRLQKSGEIIMGSSEFDGSTNSRISAFEISIERWEKNPVGGLGLGGFNSFYKTDLPQKIKYPHNLFLETLVELGIVGMVLLCILLFNLSRRIWTFRKELIVLFVYALGLAFFSKDFSSSPMLIAFGAIYFSHKEL